MLTTQAHFGRINQQNFKALLALLLCLPLFFVCVTGGSHDDAMGNLSENLVSFPNLMCELLNFGPALSICLARRFPRLQATMFWLLFAIVIAEFFIGFIPTNQLNHEGTDLPFSLVHFALTVLTLAALGLARLWCKARGP